MDRYAKAVVGAIVAGLGSVQTALADSVITPEEWVSTAVVVVAALGLIWGVPNSRDVEIHRH